MAAGVEHVSGDMFERVPSGGDAIFMKVNTSANDVFLTWSRGFPLSKDN